MATNVCAWRSRLCLPHISHACQSKFDLRAWELRKIPTAIREIASHCRKQVGQGKKRYLLRKQGVCEVDFVRRRIGMIENRITLKTECDSLVSIILDENWFSEFSLKSIFRKWAIRSGAGQSIFANVNYLDLYLDDIGDIRRILNRVCNIVISQRHVDDLITNNFTI